MSEAAAISFLRLTKAYAVGHILQKRKTVLHEITFDVQKGEIFGYLGPNGSGKTTTLKVLFGLLHPDGGEVRVMGRALADREWRQKAGYLPEHPYLYDYLTAREYLEYVGQLFGMPSRARVERARALLGLVGLERSADLALRRFSKGMVQRAGLAQALMNDPELVVLDEPMSGLDPLGRRLVRDIILDLQKQGKTVLFSTHILPDAETLCDRIAILRGGRLLDVGRLADILTLDVAHMEVLVSGVDPGVLRLTGVHEVHPVGERHRLHVDEKALGGVIRGIEQGGGRVLGVQPVRQSLEDYFLREMADEEDPRGVTTESRAGRGHQHVSGDGSRARPLQPAVLRVGDDPVRPAPAPALGPPGPEDHQGRGARGHRLLRHPHRDLHRGGARQQGNRKAIPVPSPRQAREPFRVLPRQIPGAGPHAPPQHGLDDGRA